jgi:hypothetical protein
MEKIKHKIKILVIPKEFKIKCSLIVNMGIQNHIEIIRTLTET